MNFPLSLNKIIEYFKPNPNDALEVKGFNGISIISFGLLLILIFANLIIGLYEAALIAAFSFSALVIVYFLFKKYQLFNLAVWVYSLLSYFTINFTYYYNQGYEGPSLFYFFLTFILLILITKRKYWIFWTIAHILNVGFLLWYQTGNPQLFPQIYESTRLQGIDLFISFIIVSVFILSAISFLIAQYEKEKARVLESSLKLKEKNNLIESQSKELQELLLERDKILRILSHDLKNPLSTIEQYLTIIKENDLPEETRNKIKNDLITMTRNSSEMLHNILQWSGIKLNKNAYSEELITNKEIAQNLSNIFEQNLQNKNIKLKINQEHSFSFVSNRGIILTIIRNLFSNAVKYSFEKSEIQLEFINNSENIEIRIIDFGVGLSEEARKNLFTQTQNSIPGTQSEKGSGVGLMICHDLANELNGEIFYEQNPVGGSIFGLRIPNTRKNL